MKMNLRSDWLALLGVTVIVLASTQVVLASESLHGQKGGAHGNAGGKHVHWGYAGPEGPNNWGKLSDDYELCGKGHNQSPVDIVNPALSEMDELGMEYDSWPLNIINNGHTIQVNVPSGGLLTIAGEEYQLLQYHFHAPSEHKVDGEHAPMEVHFVHKSKQGRLAVVGVMMRIGKHNPALERIWRNMPNKAGDRSAMQRLAVSPVELMPRDRTYYHYNGSLTTPPCSEGVRWFVLKESIEVEQSQVAQFKAVIGENSRPTQPMQERHVRVLK